MADYFWTIAVLENVIGLAFVGLRTRNGVEPAEEGTSTTTERYKTPEIGRVDIGVQGITNSGSAEMLLHQNLGIASDRDHNRSSEFVLPVTATPTNGKTSQDNLERILKFVLVFRAL